MSDTEADLTPHICRKCLRVFHELEELREHVSSEHGTDEHGEMRVDNSNSEQNEGDDICGSENGETTSDTEVHNQSASDLNEQPDDSQDSDACLVMEYSREFSETENGEASNSVEDLVDSSDNVHSADSNPFNEAPKDTNHSVLQCEACSLMFTTSETLQEHMVSAHGIIKQEKQEAPVVVTGSLYLNQFACKQANPPLEDYTDDFMPCKEEIDDDVGDEDDDYEPEDDINDENDEIDEEDDEMRTSEEEAEQEQSAVKVKEEPDERYYEEVDDDYEPEEGDENIDDEINSSEEENEAAQTEVRVKEEKTDNTWSSELECKLCKLISDTKQELMKHVQNYHQPEVKLEPISVTEGDLEMCTVVLDKAPKDETPFACATCGKGFSSRKNLRRHEKIHSDGEPQKEVAKAEISLHCDQCDKTFSTSTNLRVHMMTHTGERPHKCDECGKGFLTKGHLKTHLKIHSGYRPHQCSVCGKGFIKHADKLRHEATHSDVKPFVCNLCGKGMTSRTELKYHMARHSGETPFMCSQCGTGYAIKKDANKCEKKHLVEKTEYLCNLCGKSLSSERSLKYHLLTHTDDKKEFLCTHCGKSLSSKRALQAHSLLHTDRKEYLCTECGKSYSSKYILETHSCVPIEEGQEEKKLFQCTECGKSYSSKYTLESHMYVHTEAGRQGKKPFPCTECDTAYARPSDLKKHYRTVHSILPHPPKVKPPPVTCPECGRSFPAMRDLKNHMQYHARGLLGVNGLFVCEKCGREFRKKDGYDRHVASCVSVRRITTTNENGENLTTEVREHPTTECEICEKIIQVKHKTVHMRTHTDERPYVCDICNKSYKKSYLLQEHKRTHTGEKPFVCGLCGTAFARHLGARVHLRTNHGVHNYTTVAEGNTKRYVPAANSEYEASTSLEGELH